MSKLSPYEKKIWQQGFFCGLRTYKQRHNSSELESELVEVRNIVLSYIDGNYSQLTIMLKKVYRRKLHLRGRSIKRFNEDVQYYRAVLAFLAFCQSVGIDAFLDYLKDSTYFEQVLYSRGDIGDKD